MLLVKLVSFFSVERLITLGFLQKMYLFILIVKNLWILEMFDLLVIHNQLIFGFLPIFLFPYLLWTATTYSCYIKHNSLIET